MLHVGRHFHLLGDTPNDNSDNQRKKKIQKINVLWAMHHSEKTVLRYRFALKLRQKSLKYVRIPSFFAVVS